MQNSDFGIRCEIASNECLGSARNRNQHGAKFYPTICPYDAGQGHNGTQSQWVNTQRPLNNHHIADDIFECIHFLSWKICNCIQMSSSCPRVQSTSSIFHFDALWCQNESNVASTKDTTNKLFCRRECSNGYFQHVYCMTIGSNAHRGIDREISFCLCSDCHAKIWV